MKCRRYPKLPAAPLRLCLERCPVPPKFTWGNRRGWVGTNQLEEEELPPLQAAVSMLQQYQATDRSAMS